VLPIQGTYYVWVANDGKATRRQVELGVRTPGFVEARSGVDAGEQVVVGGQERLAEGAPVAVTLVDRTPASGRETVGGTAAGAGTDTAGTASGREPAGTAEARETSDSTR
jgi:hypothetical protein